MLLNTAKPPLCLHTPTQHTWIGLFYILSQIQKKPQYFPGKKEKKKKGKNEKGKKLINTGYTVWDFCKNT